MLFVFVHHQRQKDRLALSTIMLRRGTKRRSARWPPVRPLQHVGFQMMIHPELGHRFAVPAPDAFVFVGRDSKRASFQPVEPSHGFRFGDAVCVHDDGNAGSIVSQRGAVDACHVLVASTRFRHGLLQPLVRNGQIAHASFHGVRGKKR